MFPIFNRTQSRQFVMPATEAIARGQVRVSGMNPCMPRTLALVDDDEAVRDSLSALLAAAGYRVCAYSSATGFLEANLEVQFDGVILDHQMDGLTGVELLEIMTEWRRRPVAILISGNLTDSLKSRAKKAGAAAILEKPFSDDALAAALEQAFTEPRSAED